MTLVLRLIIKFTDTNKYVKICLYMSFDRHKDRPGIGVIEYNRPYTLHEELAYPLISQAFLDGTLVSETFGFEDRYRIDWASAISNDREVKIGAYRAGNLSMGLVVAVEDKEELFWIRHTEGDVCSLADGEIECPFPLSVSRKKKRELADILRSAELQAEPSKSDV